MVNATCPTTDVRQVLQQNAEYIERLENENMFFQTQAILNQAIFTSLVNLGLCTWVMSVQGNVVQLNGAMERLSVTSSTDVLNTHISRCWNSQFFATDSSPPTSDTRSEKDSHRADRDSVDINQVLAKFKQGLIHDIKLIHRLTTPEGQTKDHLVSMTCIRSESAANTPETMVFVAGLPMVGLNTAL
jgi:hypothetical protein